MTEQQQTHRMLPVSLDLEKAILASLFLLPPSYITGADVYEDDFYSEHTRAIFRAMMQVDAGGAIVDPILTVDQLRKNGELGPGKAVTSPAEVQELYGMLPTNANLSYYVAQARALKKRRGIIRIAMQAEEAAFDESSDIEEVIRGLHKKLSDAQEPRHGESVTKKSIKAVRQKLAERREGKMQLGLPTGVPAWDKTLRGIFPSEMQLIGARPKVGKTAAIETAVETILGTGKHVLVVQRDQSVETMIGRMAARKAKVVYEDFLYGQCSVNQWDRMDKALRAMDAYSDRLHIYDPGTMTADDLNSIIHREISHHKICCWFLDHFQTLQYGRDFIVEGFTKASMKLRRTINETGIPGVIIAQLNTEADKGRPTAGQFKWCDQLFSDADKIALLWSNDDPKELEVDERQEVIWTVDANRIGAPCQEVMLFHRELMTFETYVKQ